MRKQFLALAYAQVGLIVVFAVLVWHYASVREWGHVAYDVVMIAFTASFLWMNVNTLRDLQRQSRYRLRSDWKPGKR